MRIVITHPGAETGAHWVAALSARLPEAEVFASRDLEIEPPSAWPVGVVGLGVLGTQVARTIAAEGFPVRGYSQRPGQVEDVACFDASQGLREFLSGCRVAIPG